VLGARTRGSYSGLVVRGNEYEKDYDYENDYEYRCAEYEYEIRIGALSGVVIYLWL
jgi:hypothetical protein